MQLRFRIRIQHRRWMLVSLLCALVAAAAMLYCLLENVPNAVAADLSAVVDRQPSVYRMRGYYLTNDAYKGDAADGLDGSGAGVCAHGYHFASLWELSDPSNLLYKTRLGHSRSDSGMGPPSFDSGWVRTGGSEASSTTPGIGNCQRWSETAAYGTTISLVDHWSDPDAQDMHVWDAAFRSCNDPARVWCVADDIGYRTYLPIIYR